MHPTINCAIKARPVISDIHAAVKIERWKLQGHEVDTDYAGEAVLNSYYGRTEDGGGFRIAVVSQFDAEMARSSGDTDDVVISFNFSRGGNIVSSVQFSYELDYGLWFVDHESTEFLEPEDVDPAAGLAELLGIELDEHIANVIAALRPIGPELGLRTAADAG